MKFVYPYETRIEGESVFVTFPDVPGAATQVDAGENFHDVVVDCLVTALGGHVDLHKSPPRPSAPQGRRVVCLGVLASAKLALAQAMAEANMSNVALAKEMGVSEKVIRRLLDLDHVSRIDKLEEALALFSKQLEVSVRQQLDKAA